MKNALASLFACLALAGCILLEEPPPPPPPPVDRPVPIPVPQPTPSTEAKGIPGSGIAGALPLDQLWLVRVDRSTANLSRAHESLLADMSSALTTHGFQTRTVAVASLYDGRVFWASGPQLPPTGSLVDALQAEAARAPAGAPTTCPTAALVRLGANLPGVPLENAPQPRGADGNLTTTRPFSAPSGAFLVGVLDPGARPLGLDDVACRDAVEALAGAEPATWLQMADGSQLSRSQIRFAWVSTAEGVSAQALRGKCLDQGVPPSALDSLAPSPAAFYGPLTEQMNGLSPQSATAFDFCEAVGGKWPVAANTFAREWAQTLTAWVRE